MDEGERDQRQLPVLRATTPETQKRYEAAWSISSGRIASYWTARRMNVPYAGILAPANHADELYDSDPPMRPAPVMLDEVPKPE